MNNDKLDKKLNEFEPPKIKFEHNKNKLRRELLNSNLFERRSWFEKFRLRDVYITISFSILLIAFIFYNITNNRFPSIDDTISKINNSYAGIFSSNKTNYFDSKLRLYGINNEHIDLKVEKWFNYKEKKYSVILKDINSDEILDKIIIVDDQVYRMENPRLQSLNTMHSENMLIIEITNDLISKTKIDSDSIYVLFNKNFGEKFSALNENGLLVYNTENAIESEINLNDEKLNSMQINNQLNLDEYLKDNPIDILDELKNKNNLTILHDFYDELTEKTFDVIKIESSVFDSMETEMTVRISNTHDVIDSLAHKNFNDSPRVFSYYSLDSNDKLVKSDSNQITFPKKIKYVLINQENGKIEGVNCLYQKSNITTPLAKQRFTNHKSLTNDPTKFDPLEDGLVYFGSTKKVKKAIIKKFSHELTD